jgi:hypothetical protein
MQGHAVSDLQATRHALALIAQQLVRLQRASATSMHNTAGWPEYERTHYAHTHQHCAYTHAVGLLAQHAPDVLQAAIEVLDADIQRRAALYVNEDGSPLAAEFSPEFLAALNAERAQQLGQHAAASGHPQSEHATAPIHGHDHTDIHQEHPLEDASADGTGACCWQACRATP